MQDSNMFFAAREEDCVIRIKRKLRFPDCLRYVICIQYVEEWAQDGPLGDALFDSEGVEA